MPPPRLRQERSDNDNPVRVHAMPALRAPTTSTSSSPLQAGCRPVADPAQKTELSATGHTFRPDKPHARIDRYNRRVCHSRSRDDMIAIAEIDENATKEANFDETKRSTEVQESIQLTPDSAALSALDNGADQPGPTCLPQPLPAEKSRGPEREALAKNSQCAPAGSHFRLHKARARNSPYNRF